MFSKQTLIDSLSYQTEEEMISEQGFIISIMSELNNLFPDKYKKINLFNMVLTKSYGYHTRIKEIYNFQMMYKRILKKLYIPEWICHHIVNKKICSTFNNLNQELDSLREEIPRILKPSKDANYSEIFESKSSWNIFTANMHSYLNVLILTINSSEQKNNLLLVPREFSGLDILNKISNEYIIYFDDFLTDDIHNNNLEIKQEFQEIYNNNIKYLTELLVISNINYFPLINNGLKNLFYYTIPQALLFYDVLDNMSRYINIKNIIGSRVRRIYDRVSHTFAKNNYISSYILLHSTIQPNINELYSTGYFNDITGIFVWGKNHENILKKDPHLAKNSTVHIIGSPLLKFQGIKKNKTSEKVILYAASKDDINECKMLVNIISNIQSPIKLLLKVHPQQDIKKYNIFINKFIKILPHTYPIEDYYHCADILITTYSGAHITAMNEKIPVVFISISNQTTIDLRNIYGLGDQLTKDFIVYNKKQLKNKIMKLLFNKVFEENYLKIQSNYIENMLYQNEDRKYATKYIFNILNT